MPLFFWLLDTTTVNSYLIFKKSGKNISHKDFRLQLVWDLIKSSMEENKPNIWSNIEELIQKIKFIEVDPLKKNQYIIIKFELSPLRLTPNRHLKEERSSCMWCEYLNKKSQKKH